MNDLENVSVYNGMLNAHWSNWIDFPWEKQNATAGGQGQGESCSMKIETL